jgi:hypothetical protein
VSSVLCVALFLRESLFREACCSREGESSRERKEKRRKEKEKKEKEGKEEEIREKYEKFLKLENFRKIKDNL